MADDGKIVFLVMATVGNRTPFRHPFFIRAGSLREAYISALENEMFQNVDVHLEGYVIGMDALTQALQLEELARFYWERGTEQDFPTFEDAWDEHGATLNDA